MIQVHVLETAWEFESPPGHFTFLGESEAPLFAKPRTSIEVRGAEAVRASDRGNTSFEPAPDQLYFTRFPIN